MASFIKDPAAKLDYKVDWSKALGADTIATSTWTVPTGVTQVSAASTTTTATVVLSGGTDGADYSVTNHIITAAGFEDERTFRVQVRQR